MPPEFQRFLETTCRAQSLNQFLEAATFKRLSSFGVTNLSSARGKCRNRFLEEIE